jgi:hypothetical protein
MVMVMAMVMRGMLVGLQVCDATVGGGGDGGEDDDNDDDAMLLDAADDLFAAAAADARNDDIHTGLKRPQGNQPHRHYSPCMSVVHIHLNP